MSVTTIPPAATNRIIGRHWNAGTQNQVSMPTSVRTRCAGGAKYGNGRAAKRPHATPTAGSRLVTAIFRPASAGSPVAGCATSAPELRRTAPHGTTRTASDIGVPQAAAGCTVPKMPSQDSPTRHKRSLLLIDTTSCPRTHRSILIDGCSSIRRPEQVRQRASGSGRLGGVMLGGGRGPAVGSASPSRAIWLCPNCRRYSSSASRAPSRSSAWAPPVTASASDRIGPRRNPRPPPAARFPRCLSQDSPTRHKRSCYFSSIQRRAPELTVQF